jgi:hypothetical protein
MALGGQVRSRLIQRDPQPLPTKALMHLGTRPAVPGLSARTARFAGNGGYYEQICENCFGYRNGGRIRAGLSDPK